MLSFSFLNYLLFEHLKESLFTDILTGVLESPCTPPSHLPPCCVCWRGPWPPFIPTSQVREQILFLYLLWHLYSGHGLQLNYPPSHSSVPGQAGGELSDIPSEEECCRLHAGEGLHGENLHLRAGQSFLPGLISHSKPQKLFMITCCALACSL